MVKVKIESFQGHYLAPDDMLLIKSQKSLTSLENCLGGKLLSSILEELSSSSCLVGQTEFHLISPS